MSRTQIGGNRIAPKSIKNLHLSDDIQIPEANIKLNYGTHKHENKSVIDLIKNSNPALVKELDLKDVVLTILQVAEARKAGLTLKNVLDLKGDKDVVDGIVKTITEAIGTKTSLKDAMDAIEISLDNKINTHAGITAHKDLDKAFEDINNAKGNCTTLTARMQEISNAILNSGGTGTGGQVNINIQALGTWETTVKLVENQTRITTPNPYITGNSSLMVYEGPVLLTPGADNDYEEIDSTTLKLNYVLPKGAVLRLVGTNSGRLFEWIYRIKTSGGEQSLDTYFSFTHGQDDLVIYEDGLLLQPGLDFTEVNDHEVSLSQAMPSDCNITICKRRY